MVAANLTLPTTMRALLLSGLYNITVQDVLVPDLISPTDAIVKLTTSAICGSDLFAYRGFDPEQPAYVPGHEGIGYVAQVGSAVNSLSVGDYVVIPDNLHHGQLEMRESMPTSYGSGIASPGISGLQAEYARVPAADANLFPLPIPLNETDPTLERSFLTVGDIFSTGWTAVTWSGFKPGDSVAVFGAGPVGLMAAYSAVLRGASRVYSVDHIPSRLDVARSIGAIPINFVESDPVTQILTHEPMGVHRAVDCVGMEGLNAQLQFEPSIVTRQMINVTGFEGGIGQIGVYNYVPGASVLQEHPNISPNVDFPISDFWIKALKYRAGIVQPYRTAPDLINLIASEKASTAFITSAVISIEDGPKYYERFNRTEEIKVFISFANRD
ncbi:putative zinc-type alcohol dehydrogenase-like protein AdhB [Talaromyces pinophilus]|nr:putative zinc-type alcohol dehydrogenase-like protein AdhB [Talaromyces pinophilus]